MEASEYEALEREVELVVFGDVWMIEARASNVIRLCFSDRHCGDYGTDVYFFAGRKCIIPNMVAGSTRNIELWNQREGTDYQESLEKQVQENPIQNVKPRGFCSDYNSLHALHVRVAEVNLWREFLDVLGTGEEWFAVITCPADHCRAAVAAMRKDTP